jgi:hypothetical protein
MVRGAGMTPRSSLARSTMTVIDVLDAAGLHDGFVVPMSLPRLGGAARFR